MAFVHSRRGGKVYVYYTDPKTGKARQVPRAETQHLDGQPLAHAQAWVEEWERRHGLTVDRARRTQLQEGDALLTLWRAYQVQQQADRDTQRRRKTLSGEDTAFFIHIVPFFVTKRGKKLPTQWHALVPEFHAHLAAQDLSARTRQKILWTLERFGAHLVFSQIMTYGFTIRPPRSKLTKITPLKVRLEPKDVLTFEPPNLPARSALTQAHLKLAALLGYFAALSPSELFALNKSDLLTGRAAEETPTYAKWHDKGLGSRLAVVVNKSFEGTHVVEFTKNDYRTGVVTIWNSDAAKAIAGIVKTLPEGRLFPLSLSAAEHLWGDYVKPRLGCTPHDLRRASCLYLGRTLDIAPQVLQTHMRHAEIETTMLYMRKPAVPETPKKKRVQDFEDVA